MTKDKQPKNIHPQNMNNVLKEVGENIALFHLFNVTQKKGWHIARNLDEEGCDILLFKEGKKNIKIEVKARQMIITKQNSKGAIHFNISINEHKHSNFLVCYHLGGYIKDTTSNENCFFIIPITAKELKKISNGYRFIAKFKNGISTSKYKNNWDIIRKKLE